MKGFQHIIDKINGVLSEEFEVEIDRIIPGANDRQVIGLDSLDYVDLIVLIESNFSFKVKPGDFTDIISFRDLYDYISSHIQYKEPNDGSKSGQADFL